MKLNCPTCKTNREIEITDAIGFNNTINFQVIQCEKCHYSYGVIDTLTRNNVDSINIKMDTIEKNVSKLKT